MDNVSLHFENKFINKIITRLKDKNIRKQLIITLILGIVLGASAKTIYKYEVSTRAFRVALGDKEIGIVRTKGEVEELVNSMEERLTKDYNLDIVLGEDIVYEPIHASDEEVMSQYILENKLKSQLKFEVWGYSLQVNGKDIGTVKSKDMANKVLNKIKEPYIELVKKKNGKVEEVKIVEDVKIVKEKVPVSQIKEYDKVLAILQRGTDEEKIHEVKKGESFWSIAHKYNITVDDLIAANLGKDSELIQPGDKLNLIVPKPYLTVATVEEKTLTEKIEYEVKYEDVNYLYKDETRIKRAGKYGEREVLAKVKKQNGIEVAREVISETIKSQPVAQIVLKGTKAIPAVKGTGVFMSPTRGKLTSRFGSRWGKFHEGVDLASRTGTPIKAADGGTVTFAGWRGAYGYMVQIDHGGGFITRYAHCSKIYVKKGEKVYKDKTIAAVGNTGRSTGPHVHFEVRKYGTPKNPLSYIGKKYR